MLSRSIARIPCRRSTRRISSSATISERTTSLLLVSHIRKSAALQAELQINQEKLAETRQELALLQEKIQGMETSIEKILRYMGRP